MKLSELRTADELVLALTARGWAKREEKGDVRDDPAGAYITFRDTANHPDWLDHRIRGFNLYPQRRGEHIPQVRDFWPSCAEL